MILFSGRCTFCRRALNNPFDALSLDCGGDCWACIGEIEAEMGYEPSIEICNMEFMKGLRSHKFEIFP